jgi:hypothetical protein
VIDSFTTSISSPQVNGVAFSGTAEVTAYDVDGNLKDDFDASGNNVTISTGGVGLVYRGAVTPAVLDQGTDFVNGVADLGSLGINYQTGAAPEVGITFTADDAGVGTPGVSGLVDINGSTVIGGVAITDPVAATPVDADTALYTVTVDVVDIGLSQVADGTVVYWSYAVVTGSGTGSGLSASTSLTVGGVASIDLTTSRVVGDEFTVTAGDNGFIVSDTSATITVVAGGFNRLAVNIQSPQTNQVAFVGAPLTSTVTAQDTFGNTITNFDFLYPGETVVLTSSAGAGTVIAGNSIPAASFSSGVADLVGEGTTFGGNYGGGPVTFTATSVPAGVIANSAPVTILPGPADHFNIVTNIISPQTAGAGFVVRIEALDIDNNLLNSGGNSYNENDAVLSDIGPDTLSVVPSTLQFINGVWESTVTITGANIGANQTTLQVEDTVGPVTVTPDTEGPFTVNAGALHHFTFVAPLPGPNESVNNPFNITVQARDAFDNLVTSYDGVDFARIEDNTGTIFEDPTPGDKDISFTNGVYGPLAVVITLERFDNVITVTDNPGGPGTGSETGTSNPFSVVGSTVPVSLDSSRAPKNALTGETGVEMMEITIYNLHPSDDIILSSIDVWVESSSNSVSETVIPSTLISSMSVDGNPGTPPNSLTFVSVPVTDTIPFSQSRTYTIIIDVALDISNAVIPNIQLRLADVNGLRGGGPIIPVNLDNGDPLNDPDGFIRSNITNISVSKDDATYNYPNPFNPMKQQTNIVYYSDNQGTTTIKIFTITGKIVRTISDSTVVGSNEAVWDGKNGRGQIVRNGVYVAVIMTPDGSRQTVKIAVVK